MTARRHDFDELHEINGLFVELVWLAGLKLRKRQYFFHQPVKPVDLAVDAQKQIRQAGGILFENSGCRLQP